MFDFYRDAIYAVFVLGHFIDDERHIWLDDNFRLIEYGEVCNVVSKVVSSDRKEDREIS